MKTILRAMAAASAAVLLSACALLAPMRADDDARYAANVTLTAYEATQQALLLYGRLPNCDPANGALRFCKRDRLWQKIKIVEAAASKSIYAALPVLNGTKADAGELVAAVTAIAKVTAAVREAQAALADPVPVGQ